MASLLPNKDYYRINCEYLAGGLMKFLLSTAMLIVALSPNKSMARLASLSSITSADLVELCEQPHASSPGVRLDPCAAYILGVADALSASQRFCNSGGAWTLQAVTIARRYIHDHPEEWGKHPYTLVSTALVQAFPCTAKAGR